MMEATNSLKSVILETQVNGGQPVFDDPTLCNTYKYSPETIVTKMTAVIVLQ